MAKGKNVRKIFKNEDGEGMMTTEFATANLSGLHGIIFEADIETEAKKGKVKFLVRPVDVSKYNDEDFIWTPVAES